MSNKQDFPTGPTTPQQGSQKILAALQGLRYGSVEIVVHDGRIVQIERREKLRLDIDCPPKSRMTRT
jgi:hypothetical protein